MRGTSISSTSAYRLYFRALYGELFRRIAVRPEIAAAAQEWAAANLDEAVVGVQVRTWRDDPRRHRKYHVPSLRRLTRLLGLGAERTVSRRQRQRRRRADARRSATASGAFSAIHARRRAPIAG